MPICQLLKRWICYIIIIHIYHSFRIYLSLYIYQFLIYSISVTVIFSSFSISIQATSHCNLSGLKIKKRENVSNSLILIEDHSSCKRNAEYCYIYSFLLYVSSFYWQKSNFQNKNKKGADIGSLCLVFFISLKYHIVNSLVIA